MPALPEGVEIATIVSLKGKMSDFGFQISDFGAFEPHRARIAIQLKSDIRNPKSVVSASRLDPAA
jgi:hypothetical protein